MFRLEKGAGAASPPAQDSVVLRAIAKPFVLHCCFQALFFFPLASKAWHGPAGLWGPAHTRRFLTSAAFGRSAQYQQFIIRLPDKTNPTRWRIFRSQVLDSFYFILFYFLFFVWSHTIVNAYCEIYHPLSSISAYALVFFYIERI